MIVARATSPDVVVESRDENNFVASLRARAVPHTTRDAPTYRYESIRPPRASVRVFAHRIVHRRRRRPTAFACTHLQRDVVDLRKKKHTRQSFVRVAFAHPPSRRSSSARARAHRASDPNTPRPGRSRARRHALDARRRARSRHALERLTSTSSNVHLPKSLISCVVAMSSASQRGGWRSGRSPFIHSRGEAGRTCRPEGSVGARKWAR